MMGKLIKKIVIILLAFGVFASTIFVESRIPVEAMSVTEKRVVVVPGDKEIQPGAEITTGSTESITVRYDDNGVVRLAPSSSVTFVKEGEDGYVFRLNSGRAWVNNVFTSSYLNVQSGGSLLLPRKAAFDIEAKTGSSVVRIFSSQVVVGLIPSDFAADKILRFQDNTLINSFLLAQGSQATISNDKVAQNEDVLRKLLYSKLIKEFQSSLMDKAAVAEDSWIADNLKADQELVRNVSQLKVDAINGRNLKFSSLESFAYQMDQTFSRMSDTLTFSEEKKTKRLIEGIFDHIYDTEYLLVFGRSTEAKERMNLFKKLIAEQFAGADEKMKSLLLGKLRKLYADLNFVLPDNALYEVKVAVSDLLASQLGHDAADITEKLGLIRDYINYAYALADTNLVQARLSLQQYYDRFTALMEAERSRLESVRFLVSEENQILDNLLRQYPQFYQDTFFAMKLSVETEWLKLLPEGPDKVEERQTIISTKIDFLKQLQLYFLDEQIALNDARLVTVRLINEIRDLQTGDAVGVNELFAQRLKDYGNFLLFLNTTNVSQLRGSSPEVQYEEFKVLQKEEISIEKALNVVLGEDTLEQPTLTTSDILIQIRKDFENLGAANLQFGAMTDTGQQLVDVSGELENTSFTLKYDWDKQLVSNVRSGTKLLSADPVRLGALPSLLAPQQATQETKETQTQQPQAEMTKAEKVALSLLIQKLKANNITVDPKNIVISDLDKGLFVINGATLTENKKVQIAFVYQTKGDIVTSLIVRTPVGDRKLTDTIKLAEVSPAAEQAYAEGAAEKAAADNE